MTKARKKCINANVLFLSFGKSDALWISNITIPRMSLAAEKLYASFFFPATHDFLNTPFCARAVGVAAPDDGMENELAGRIGSGGVETVGIESTEWERPLDARLGKSFGILNADREVCLGAGVLGGFKVRVGVGGSGCGTATTGKGVLSASRGVSLRVCSSMCSGLALEGIVICAKWVCSSLSSSLLVSPSSELRPSSSKPDPASNERTVPIP